MVGNINILLPGVVTPTSHVLQWDSMYTTLSLRMYSYYISKISEWREKITSVSLDFDIF
jgi:hypothetical protein